MASLSTSSTLMGQRFHFQFVSKGFLRRKDMLSMQIAVHKSDSGGVAVQIRGHCREFDQTQLVCCVQPAVAITSYFSAAPSCRTSNGGRTPFSRMLSRRNCISSLSCTLYGLSSNGWIFNQLQPLPSKTDKTFLEIFMNANLSSKNRSVQPEIQLCAPVCFAGANIAFFA